MNYPIILHPARESARLDALKRKKTTNNGGQNWKRLLNATDAARICVENVSR